jgi:repressor LexA
MERREQLLRFIGDFQRKNDYPPTVEEMRRGLQWSTKSLVDHHLNALAEAGLIDRQTGKARSVRLRERVGPTFSIPLLANIPASPPRDPGDGYGGDTIELTRDILRRQPGLYALRVKGDSMVDAMIHDGDLVVMKHQQHADNGDLVAVWLPESGETTLKRFYRENGHVRLQPCNPTMKPLYFRPNQIEVQGKVMLVIRQLA